jgi:endoglucanase Acf2
MSDEGTTKSDRKTSAAPLLSSTTTATRQPQYHLYGSYEIPTGTDPDGVGHMSTPSGVSIRSVITQSDQDSLDGETLVNTDTEGEATPPLPVEDTFCYTDTDTGGGGDTTPGELSPLLVVPHAQLQRGWVNGGKLPRYQSSTRKSAKAEIQSYSSTLPTSVQEEDGDDNHEEDGGNMNGHRQRRRSLPNEELRKGFLWQFPPSCCRTPKQFLEDDVDKRESLQRRREAAMPLVVTVIVTVVILSVATLVLFPKSHANVSRLFTPSTSPSSPLEPADTNGVLSFVAPQVHVNRRKIVQTSAGVTRIGGDPVPQFLRVELFHPKFLQSTPRSKASSANRNRRDDDESVVNSSSSHWTTVSSSNEGDDDADAAGPLFTFPFPTGAFWTNFVVPATADRGLSYPVAVYPYAYQWSPTMLRVSYPAAHRSMDATSIHDYFFPDLTFTTLEATAFGTGDDETRAGEKGVSSSTFRHVRSFDALSVTLRFTQGRSQSGQRRRMTATESFAKSSTTDGSFADSPIYWESYLVPGSPYVTLSYGQHMTPVIRALTMFADVGCPQDADTYDEEYGTGNATSNPDEDLESNHTRRRLAFGICSVTDDTANHTTTLKGIQFILKLNEGLTWILFASVPITLVYNTRERTTLVSNDSFKGVLRLALIPPQPSTTPAAQEEDHSSLSISSSTGLQRLIYHAGVYPVSGDVSWSFDPKDNHSGHVPSTSKIFLSASAVASTATSTKRTNSGSTGNSTSNVSNAGAATSQRTGTIKFTYATGYTTPVTTGTQPKALLMLALPHHAQALSSSVQLGPQKFDLVYSCIKGPMQPVVGESWSYDEPLLDIGFGMSLTQGGDAPQFVTPGIKAVLRDNVERDVKLALPTMNEDIYGFGKQAARVANLVLIAEQLLDAGVDGKDAATNRSSSSAGDQLFKSCLDALRLAMTGLLDGKSFRDQLVYDTSLGGIVASDGLLNTEADFGNGRYNDHHFHYGYLLYAAAVLGKYDSSFVKKYGMSVDAVYYDIAHNKNFDSTLAPSGAFFPGTRHKIWFDGHSFASGLFPFGNGKSQESSSEAVNAYYGAFLWSLVRNGAASNPSSDTSEQTDFARLLLATEIRGAQMYWQMRPTASAKSHTQDLHAGNTSGTVSSLATGETSIYPPSFAKNYMVGNLGMLDAVCTTWFGTQVLYVHLINFLPVTAVTASLFSEGYAQVEYPAVLEPMNEVESAWRGFKIAIHAIVNATSAWSEAQELSSPELDAGFSKSQLLWWIATRPGFDTMSIDSHNSDDLDAHGNGPYDRGGSGDKQGAGGSTANHRGTSSGCSSNSKCAKLGLVGQCCPSEEGIMLGCC